MIYARDKVLIFAALASIILSIWGAYSETVINPDGICYLLSAQSLSEYSWQQVLHLCPQSGWPFYSLLIHGLANLTHLSYNFSAYSINGLFSLLSVLAFLLICKEMGANNKLLWIAALAILLHHDFNSLRQSVIRDHGYWACYLWSMWLAYHYLQKPSLNRALLWSLSVLLATLFRREGIFFLCAVPIGLCLSGSGFKQRLQYFFQLNMLCLIALVIGLLWAYWHPQICFQLLQTTYDQAVNLVLLTKYRFHVLHEYLKTNVIKSASQNDVSLVLLLVYLNWYLLNIINALNWAYAAMVLVGLRALQLSRNWRVIIITYIVINLVITFVFQVEHQFISKRYVLALCLTLMLFIPFAWSKLEKHRYLLAGLIIMVLISAFGGIVGFGVPKTFIHTAGDWIATNIPQNANLYVNDYQLMYYSQHYGYNIFAKIHDYHRIETIADGKWKNFDYLALRLSHTDPQSVNNIVHQITIQPMTIFQNKRGDYVAIYKVAGEA